MSLEPWLSVLAAAGNLLVCCLVATRRPRAHGRRPLALLCLALAMWNLGDLSEQKIPAWAVAALLPAFTFNFTLRFLGIEERHRGALVAAWGLSWSFFLLTLSALVWEAPRAFAAGIVWNGCYLALLMPFGIWSLGLLARAAAGETQPRRRRAIRYVLAAGVLGLSTGLLDLLRLGLPRVGAVGSLACMAVLGTAILRLHLLEIDVAIGRLAVLGVLAALPPLALYSLVEAPGAAGLAVSAASFAALGLGGWTVSWWQEQAERRRRLAELGEISALLAHEIRNPLAAIKGAAQYLEADLKDGPAAEYVGLILGEINRLDAALGDVQYFVRPVTIEGAPVELGRLIEEVARAQRAGLPPGVGLRAEAAPGLPPVRADARLLAQLLVNLLRNAIEAVGDAGRVVLEARPAAAGGAVVTVRDTGPGIPEEIAERIFEPYFTTKTRGMGLGLALSRRIAEAHGGTLEAENLPGGGAEFRLELPPAGG